MIELFHDNILVEELVKNTKAGLLTVNQDSSSPYMYVKIIKSAIDAYNMLSEQSDLIRNSNSDDLVLIIRRTAKDPFINNQFFISAKDVRAVITKEYFNSL